MLYRIEVAVGFEQPIADFLKDIFRFSRAARTSRDKRTQSSLTGLKRGEQNVLPLHGVSYYSVFPLWSASLSLVTGASS